MKLVNIHILTGLFLFSLAGSSPLNAQPLTLEQCVETALRDNRALRAGRNDQALYAEQKEEAQAGRMPKATVSADYRFFTNLPYQLMPLSAFNGPEGQFREVQFGVPHNLGLNVQLAVPLYSPQIKNGVRAAEIAGDLHALQTEKKEEQLIIEVANLYYNAQILQQQLVFADSNLVNAGQLLKTVELLRRQGLAMGTDVEKVALQQAQLQAQRAKVESYLAQALGGLKLLMGLEAGAPLAILPDLPAAEAAVYPVRNSVDTRIVLAQQALIENDLDRIQNATLPTISLVANYGLTGFGYLEQPDAFFKLFPVGFLGAQLTYPLWDPANRHRTAHKQIALQSNRLQTEHVQAQAEWMIAKADLQRSAALSALPSAQQNLTWAESLYQQTLVQQAQGLATLTDILMADNAIREAQQGYLHFLIEYLKADLELKQASGFLNY